MAVLLMLLVPMTWAVMRSGGEEPPKGEQRIKTLAYYADSNNNNKIGLYWVDEELNVLRKATTKEIERCHRLHPDEKLPVCKTYYYDERGG